MQFEIGYKVALEQVQPDAAIEHAIEAEKIGFDFITASDHFHPWFHTNAASSFAWVWLGSLARATRVRFGTSITCPCFRYHPALVAQSFATLDYMYPGRVFLALGSGEALNEMPLGFEWPSHKERIARVEEAITIIRRLWDGGFVNHQGHYYTIRRARLYTPPKTRIPIILAASGARAAELAGRVADGLLTSTMSKDALDNVIFQALKRGLVASHREFDSFPKSVEIGVSYDEDYNKALQAVRPWAGSMLPVFYKAGISDPREIELNGSLVGDRQISESTVIGTSAEPFLKAMEERVRMGFRSVHVVNASPSPLAMIRIFKEVVPYLREEFK